MRYKKLKIDKQPFVFLLLLSIVIAFLVNARASSVSAQGSYPLPKVSNDNSLTVKLRLMDEADSNILHKLPDEKLKLTPVALMQLNTAQQSVEYRTLDAFLHLGIVWENMSASESNKLAKTISAELQTSSADFVEAITDANGDAVFSQLSNGIYLVEHVEPSSNPSYKTQIEPFLISVPCYMKETGEDTWSYQVEVYPKAATIKPVPDETTKPTTQTTKSVETEKPSAHISPRTGEMLELYPMIVLIMLPGVLIFLKKQLRRNDKNEIS